MDHGPFLFGGQPLSLNPHAQIQGGTRRLIQDLLDLYKPGWFTDVDLIILEHAWDTTQGRRLVVPLNDTSVVRYALDPDSKAKPQNRQPVPFVLLQAAGRTKQVSVYLCRIGDSLHLVRAHFGRPFPPAPFQASAQKWPGHTFGKLDLKPGAKGCLEYWRDHAYITTDPDQFRAMSSIKPDWLN